MAITKATASSIAPAAKGNLVVGSATNDAAVLAVGANGTILTADSAEATGVKWAAAAAGGKNYSLLNSGGTALTGAATITVSGISNIDQILVLVIGASSASASSTMRVRINSVATNYYQAGFMGFGASSYSAGNLEGFGFTAGTGVILASMSGNAGSLVSGGVLFQGCATTGVKIYTSIAGATTASSNNQDNRLSMGSVVEAATVSSVSIVSGVGDFDAGTIYVYGAS
jgi:hypothetical protein